MKKCLMPRRVRRVCRRAIPALTAIALTALPFAAYAWGPQTQGAIVSTAVRMISRQADVPLGRLESDVLAGARQSVDAITDEYMPQWDSQPIAALEQQIYLLQEARPESIDPYFAYRLGALGAVVADYTAPMQDAPAGIRDEFYNDIDNVIGTLSLTASSPSPVDPRPYFEEKRQLATMNNEMIRSEYESGLGFDGAPRQLVAEAATRSLRAVVDTWHTILTSRSVGGSISTQQLQAYVTDAMEYYVQLGNEGAIATALDHLRDVTPFTADMHARFGDLFREAGFRERALEQYQAALAIEPDRQDVNEKIARYFVEEGERALSEGELEVATEAFGRASEANPLDPDAEGRRFEAAQELQEREERRMAQQNALERAQEFQALAQQEAQRNRYAEAIALLRQAEAAYRDVTSEFSTLAQQRDDGVETVQESIGQMREQLMASAQSFSGTAFEGDARALADAASEEVSEATLRALIEEAYRNELEELREDLEDDLAVR